MSVSFPKAELQNRADIEKLVNAFYERVREDDLIGPVFGEVARTDWQAHLPRMYDFWEKVLFRTGPFQGNPLAVHHRLAQSTPMGREQFDRWLGLFCGTVDDLFCGVNASHIKNCAVDMAAVIHRKINHMPDPSWITPAGISGPFKAV